jgi:hypothetical protein
MGHIYAGVLQWRFLVVQRKRQCVKSDYKHTVMGSAGTLFYCIEA